MTRWHVQLTGDAFDLEELPGLFAEPEASVSHAEGRFELTSVLFEQLADADQVRRRAMELVQHLNGSARLVFGHFKAVSVGAVQEEGPGGRAISVMLEEGLELRARASAVVVAQGRAQQPPSPPPPAITNNWVKLALRDGTAARVLRLLGAPKCSWHDLYKIMEILESHEGNNLLDALGIAENKISCFAQTANSMAAIGDEARHAKASIPPPATPMDISEARQLIHRWAREWLTTRGAF